MNCPRIAVPCLLALALLVVAASWTAGSAETPPTSAALIERARTDGRIGFEQAALLKAYALYAPWKLSDEYRGAVPEKCGTHLAIELDRALPSLPQAITDEIRDLRARPSCDSYYDTAHFRIHYDTSGQHMILGWPDTSYRDAVAAVVEHCLAAEVDTLGFRAPPSDGGDPDGGGGNSLYDIYLQNCSGYYGYCQGSYTVPFTPRTDCTSYIVIDNDYAGFGYPDPTDPMKVTVAHELCHACQFSHDYDEPTWYMECTSVWVEDVVYDDVDDYRGYLFYYLNYPYCSLDWNDPTGLRMYGSCIWNFFLSEHVDAGIVPDIWYQAETLSNIYVTIDAVLSGHSTSLEDAFTTYAVWTWFTGSRDDGNHYEEGAFWPLVAAEKTYGSYPLVGCAPLTAHRPDHMAWNYMHFNNPGGTQDRLEIIYRGPDKAPTPNHAYVNTKEPDGDTFAYGEMFLNPSGDGAITVTGWDDLSQACVVAVNASTGSDDMEYSVDADRTTPVGGTFYAALTEQADVVLRWTLEHAGGVESLDILRSASHDGPFEKINDEPLPVGLSGSYVDRDVLPGEELWYVLVVTFSDGSEETVPPGVAYIRVTGTMGLSLAPPSPNPFTDRAEIAFTVPAVAAAVTLRICDATGRVVRTLTEGPLDPGRYVRTWNGTDRSGRRVAAGVYFCSLEASDALLVQKIVLLR